MLRRPSPPCRLSHLELEEYAWRVSLHTLPKPTITATGVPDASDPNQVHYIYVCVKR